MLTKLELDVLTTPGRYLTGGVPGLYVQVSLGVDGQPRRSFVYRYKIAGRAREAGLGSYPATSLSEARARAREAATLRSKGIDPLAAKATAKAEAAVARVTFQKAAEALLDHICKQRANGKFPLRAVRQWRSSLSRFVYPKIGKLDVRDIRYEHLTAILIPVATAKGKTKRSAVGGPTVAASLRSRVERILDFSSVHGWRDPNLPNPARPQLFKDVLGKQPPAQHFAAPPLDIAPSLYQAISAAEGSVYRAVEWMILSCSRLRESLDAKFSEVDPVTRIWTVPAHRSKTGRDHPVPMSAAMSRVYEAASATRCSDYMFPGRFNSPLASSTIGPALDKIGVGYTRHGWRSTARDAMADRLDIDRETAEFVLAHVVGGVEGAYRRETAIVKRRVAMQKWADWLAGKEADSNVIPLRQAAE
jgi:integrase